MFSKTGNTVDSAVNQALHQGVGTNPLQSATGQVGQAINQGLHPGQNQGVLGQGVGQGLAGQGVGQVLNQGLHGGNAGLGQGLVGQGVGQVLNQGLHGGNTGLGGALGAGALGAGVGQVLNQGLHPGQHQGLGQGVLGQVGQGLMGSQLGPSATGDQSLGHQALGTMQGMVGQGVSTGLGYHSDVPLPSRHLDPQVHDTTKGHHGLGTGLATGAAAGAGAGALANHALKPGKGAITFRPIEARFNHDKDLLGKMDPYCKFKIGLHRGKSAVAKGQGVTPTWNDSVVVKHKKQEFAKLKVKDHDKLRHDDTIGIAKIPLDQVLASGMVDQWIPVEKHGKVTGEVHLIMEYAMGGAGLGNVNTNTI